MQVDDPEFASISAQVRQMDRAQLERTAAIVSADVSQTGQASAELVRSDREYAQEQERSRRKFAIDRDSDRANHEAHDV